MIVREFNDTELVARSLAGDRDAFSRIVSRYQTLICSLAYSRIGNLGQSEDIAQETFIAAWKHLRLLREPAKLRSWLCGIVRNRIHKALRHEGREPVHNAEPLDLVQESTTAGALPSEDAISHEEETILWRSLEKIPELYREPLVLFYREHQSIEAVAAELDLSEEAVKQRLSRGRKLLHQEVLAFVESALERTSPGKAFTISILATIPMLSTSAKAATLGIVAVKGGVAAKSATALGLFNAFLAPVLGFVGPWLQYRTFLAAAKTDAERKNIQTYYHRLLELIFAFGALLIGLIFFGRRYISAYPGVFAGLLLALVTAYVAAAARMGAWANRMFRTFRAECAAPRGNQPVREGWEYRSKLELLGLPLIHFRFNRLDGRRTPVKAWLAGGECAFGLLFAFGGLAVAPLSFGGIAIGLIPWGGAALGLFVIGGFAFGGWAFGGIALGWQAFGGCAIGLDAAMGGLAIARDFALGGVAEAAEMNNALASQFINGSLFFRSAQIFSHYIAWLNLLWLIPFFSWRHLLSSRRHASRGR